MRRYLCIWFPNWAMERYARAQVAQPHRPLVKSASIGSFPLRPPITAKPDDPSAPPFVFVEAGKAGLCVAAANRSALALGVEPGLKFTDAKARVPSLLSQPIDRRADRNALRRLARWMVRWSPLVAIDGEEGLCLDITGCARVFGGEAAIVEGILNALKAAGLTGHLAVAGTIGAASAGARAGPGALIIPPGDLKRALKDMPVSGLRLSQDALTLLRRFGLNTIGQLYGIDRKALARRFRARELADQTQLRLDQALGRRHEPIHPLAPPPDYTARLSCPEPLVHTEGVAAGLSQLADALCNQLANQGVGAQRFVLSAFHSDGTRSDVAVSAARPVREAAHILRLFRERLERIDPGFGIDFLLLSARRVEAMTISSPPLSADLAGVDADIAALSALADRITARLGEGAVGVLAPKETHIPEASERANPFEGVLMDWSNRKVIPRPLFLFDRPEPLQVIAEVPEGPPERFVWRRVTRRVARADGPERIAPEWWRHFPPAIRQSLPEETERRWLTPKMDPRADAVQIARIRQKYERDLMSRRSDHAPSETDASDKSATTSTPGQSSPRTRDYYRIEEAGGHRFWVFREGLYEGTNPTLPQWFIHGIFA